MCQQWSALKIICLGRVLRKTEILRWSAAPHKAQSPLLKMLQNKEVASLAYKLGNEVCSGERVTEASAVVSNLNMKYITWF